MNQKFDCEGVECIITGDTCIVVRHDKTKDYAIAYRNTLHTYDSKNPKKIILWHHAPGSNIISLYDLLSNRARSSTYKTSEELHVFIRADDLEHRLSLKYIVNGDGTQPAIKLCYGYESISLENPHSHYIIDKNLYHEEILDKFMQYNVNNIIRLFVEKVTLPDEQIDNVQTFLTKYIKMDAIEYQKKYPYYKPLYERFIEQFGKDTKVPSDIDVISFINSAYRGIPLQLKDKTPFTVNEKYVYVKSGYQFPLIYLIEDTSYFIPIVKCGSETALLLGNYNMTEINNKKILGPSETVEVDKIYGVTVYLGKSELSENPYGVKFILSWIDENRVAQNQVVEFHSCDEELSFRDALIKVILQKRYSTDGVGYDIEKFKKLFN